MSLIVCVRGPEGIALGSDSRRVVVLRDQYLTIDDSPKVIEFASQPHVAALFVGYGGGINNLRRALVDADARLPRERVPVREVARLLVEIAAPTAPTQATLLVAGYDADGTSRVFVSDVPTSPEPVEHAGYGIVYAGQREFVDRMLQGYDARLHDSVITAEARDDVRMAIPLDQITLRGSLELAQFLLETTIGAQRFITGICGVGGPVLLATITSEGFRWVQQPEPGGSSSWQAIGEALPAVTGAHPDGIRAATYTVTAVPAIGT